MSSNNQLSALQKYTFVSKYANYNKSLKRRETFEEAVQRVKSMHKEKYSSFNIDSYIDKAFDLYSDGVVVGSQRNLQFAGPAVFKHMARSYNCSGSYCDRLRFFQEAMYLLLCGTGVGFSVQKHHVNKLPNLIKDRKNLDVIEYVIPDSIEGWSDAIGVLLSSYFEDPVFSKYNAKTVYFNYSEIRPKGSLFSHGCGKAPGPEPLKKAIEKIQEILDSAVKSGQEKLTPIQCYDIVMHSSDAVLSGGIRRSATIAIFSPDDEDMMKAKTGDWYIKNPQRGRSNNSALLVRGKTSKEIFHKLMECSKFFGEPGFIWADSTELIVNPCCEIQFYCYDDKGNSGWQLCNLSSINGSKIKTKSDFKKAVEAATIIGTLQAGYNVFEYLGPVSEYIVSREALLGVSVTGMMENPEILLNPNIQKEMAEYAKEVNAELAEKIKINKAARITCIKPEGCQDLDTKIKTDKGDLSLRQIFERSGYTEEILRKMIPGTFVDIFEEIYVYDKDNNRQKITSLYYNGIPNRIVSIEMEDGTEIQCTPNHKFYVKRNNEFVWVEAFDIKDGDDILSY